MSNQWERVNRRRPCPICGRPDWCLTNGPADSPVAVICARVESSKRCGEAGWLHILREDDQIDWRWIRQFSIPLQPEVEGDSSTKDFEGLARRWESALRPEALERLASSLGLKAESLRRLTVGWSARTAAYSFPMRDAGGLVVGIRLRLLDGRKLSVTGGREGLFIPEGLSAGGRLCITEGPSDCAALLDAGLAAVGRPSCSGGVKAITGLVARLRPDEVAILADGDTPGRRGGENLASILAAYVGSVRLLTPPPAVKDARAWRNAGATRSDIETAIEAAPVRRIGITTRRAPR